MELKGKPKVWAKVEMEPKMEPRTRTCPQLVEFHPYPDIVRPEIGATALLVT